jgi:hypothetical protein
MLFASGTFTWICVPSIAPIHCCNSIMCRKYRTVRTINGTQIIKTTKVNKPYKLEATLSNIKLGNKP